MIISEVVGEVQRRCQVTEDSSNELAEYDQIKQDIMDNDVELVRNETNDFREKGRIQKGRS